ncbi:MAG: hypothetical protein KC550_06935, partial [Nanoarchaeota archaeon]|nr:hypothetical protein [Nanoarchaeota archaeon]
SRNVPFQTSRCDSFVEYDTNSRSRFAIEIGNHYPLESLWNSYNNILKKTYNLSKNDFRDQYIRVSVLFEQFPNIKNFISIDEKNRDFWNIPIPKLTYNITHDLYRGFIRAKKIIENIFKEANIINLPFKKNINYSGHHLGGLKMGLSERTSVVKPNLNIHGLDNLYVISSGVFVTGTCSNPSLTLAALSLRLADFIKSKK